MKLVKMSLAAAVLLGASAFAIDNVKVSGDAKLFYLTSDMGGDADLFDKDSAAADTALRISATGDLTKGVSFGVTGYAVSTLGLENNLVSNTWTGAHDVTPNGSSFGAQVDDQAWIGEAWLAATLGKTTAKIGRMELDTPLAFSEKWSIVPNTFDAAVVINQDIPDTTLVGAWVGKANGVNIIGVHTSGALAIDNSTAIGDNLVGAGADFGTFMKDGAYAAAIVNNSFKPLTAQAWYYNISDIANAYWLQGDLNCQLVKGLTFGAQYAEISPKGELNGAPDSTAYALKVGYAVDALKVSAAYSSTDEDGFLPMANVATNTGGAISLGGQSKLYTETWWTYGVVGIPGMDSWNLTAEYDAGVAKLGAYYTNSDSQNADATLNELALTASKSFGPLDVTLAYVNSDLSGADVDPDIAMDNNNMIQAYLTLNF